MHFTEEANFQWIFEDLADSYTEIHFLYMKEAGKKKKKATQTWERAAQKLLTNLRRRGGRGGGVNLGRSGRAEGLKNLA